MAEDNPPAHRMARELKVVRNGPGKPASLFIDGDLFPYFTLDGYAVHPRRNEMPSLSFVLVADRVIVLDQMDEASEDPSGAG